MTDLQDREVVDDDLIHRYRIHFLNDPGNKTVRANGYLIDDDTGALHIGFWVFSSLAWAAVEQLTRVSAEDVIYYVNEDEL